jgi:hypothetical protein
MSLVTGNAAPVSHGAWMAARRDILDVFAAGEPLVALTGLAGVGKSRLLREIEEALRAQDPDILRVESGEWVDVASAPRVLLVDEAGRMDDAMLARVAQRAEGFTVLVGLPAFVERLTPWAHMVVELAPLRPRDIDAYVAARIAATGLDGTRLGEGTVAALAEAAGGIPSLLNLLIGTSFLMADMADSPQVTPAHVGEAKAMHTEIAPGAIPEAEALPASAGMPDPEPPPAPAPPRVAAPSPPPPAPPPAPVARKQGHGRLALAAVATALVIGGGLAWMAQREEPGAPPPVSAQPATAMLPPAAEASPSAPLPPAAGSTTVAASIGEVEATTSPPADPTTTLPSGAMVRVVITYPRAAPGAAERATALAAELDRAGISAGAPFPLSRQVTTPELSYFFREDRDAALQVQNLGATQLGRAVPRLGTVGGALPRPGAIELGLPATASAVEEPPPATAEAEAPAPEAATLTAPANGTTLPLEAAQRGIPLSWRLEGEARPGCCFVEVVALGGDNSGREVFAAYAEAADQQTIRLSRAGRYAWRVLTVLRAAQRYTASPWQHFMIGEVSP